MVWKEDDEESVNSSCSTIVNYDQQISSDEEDLEAESTSTKQVKYFFCISIMQKIKLFLLLQLDFVKKKDFQGTKQRARIFLFLVMMSVLMSGSNAESGSNQIKLINKWTVIPLSALEAEHLFHRLNQVNKRKISSDHIKILNEWTSPPLSAQEAEHFFHRQNHVNKRKISEKSL